MNWDDYYAALPSASQVAQDAEDLLYLSTFGVPYTLGVPVPSEKGIENAVTHPINTATDAVVGFSTGMILVLAVGAYFLLKK